MEFSDLWNIQFNKTAKTGRVDLPNGDFYDLEEGSWRSGDDFAVGGTSDEFKQEQNIYHDVLAETPAEELNLHKLHVHMQSSRHHAGLAKAAMYRVNRAIQKIKDSLSSLPRTEEIGDETNLGKLFSGHSSVIGRIQALAATLKDEHEQDHARNANHGHRGTGHPAYESAYERFIASGGTPEDLIEDQGTVDDEDQ